MHALIVSRSLPHHRTGGMEWHTQDVIEGLMEAGHRVSVLTTPLPDRPALKALEVNGDIIELGSRGGSYGLRFPFDFARKARRLVQALRPDVIHAQGFGGILCEEYLRGIAPIVTTVHGTLWSETPLRDGSAIGERLTLRQRIKLSVRYRHRYMAYPFWRRFLGRRPNIIVDSRFTSQELKNETGSNLDHVAVVPLGFDLSRFPVGDRKEIREKWKIGPEEVLLFSVSRLEKIKQPRLILRAAAPLLEMNPHLRLIIGGEGPEFRRLDMDARSHPAANRILFTGKLQPQEVAELFQAADLFINADNGAPAFGLTNAEALCMGTPILASNVGAHSEVIASHDDGHLVPATDSEAWQAEMGNIVKTLPESASTRERRSRDARLRFDRSLMISRIVRVYTRLHKKSIRESSSDSTHIQVAG